MLYKSFTPAQPLREFVRNYTIIHFEFNRHQSPPVKQRAPQAEQKIVFYVNGSVNLIDGHRGNTTPPPVAIYNHQLERKNLQVSPNFLALVIYLQPGALHKLIRLPISEFTSQYEDAEAFFGTEVRTIREQLADSKSFADMVVTAEKFLLSKFRSVPAISPVDIVACTLLSDPVSFSLDAMADHACLSTKQFYRKFVERVGISPKFFSRLCRFNRAYRYKLSNPGVSWSAIAQEYSYTDYHHLEKEFKSFVGHTPAQWLSAELAAPERLLKLR